MSAAPASILDDAPLAVAAGGAVWQPRDDDGEFRGLLPARVALETSRNLPAARGWGSKQVREELFLAGRAPRATCRLHGGWLALPVAQGDGVPTERPGFFRRLLAGLFGRHPKRN